MNVERPDQKCLLTCLPSKFALSRYCRMRSRVGNDERIGGTRGNPLFCRQLRSPTGRQSLCIVLQCYHLLPLHNQFISTARANSITCWVSRVATIHENDAANLWTGIVWATGRALSASLEYVSGWRLKCFHSCAAEVPCHELQACVHHGLPLPSFQLIRQFCMALEAHVCMPSYLCRMHGGSRRVPHCPAAGVINQRSVFKRVHCKQMYASARGVRPAKCSSTCRDTLHLVPAYFP